MQKDYKIDNIRAIAIISVVIGHSIILYSNSWNLYNSLQSSAFFNYLMLFIGAYQMPLFFSLSGYLFAKTRGKSMDFLKYISKKFRRLIIPFIVIALFWMIPIKMLLHYPYYDGMSYPTILIRFLKGYHLGHLWYLPTLFFIFVIMYCVVKLFGDKEKTYIIAFGITMCLNCFHERLPLLKLIYPVYIYRFAWSFVLGTILYKTKLITYIKSFSKAITIITVIITILHVFNWIINDTIVATAIILTAYLIMPNKSIRLLEKISNHSYGIYLLHSPLIYITFTFLLDTVPIVVVAVNLILFGGLAYIITDLLKKSKLRFIIGD